MKTKNLPLALLTSAFCLLTSYLSFSQGTWSQKANFGGLSRTVAVGFSIGTKGYIGTGYDINTNSSSAFWEYNSITDSWTQKADFGGVGRYQAAGFSIGTKGYIGTGLEAVYTNDFWEYDPSNNTWSQKANFGGAGRNRAVGFSLGTKGYLGMGYDGSGERQDFWEYDPSSDTWIQKADYPVTRQRLAFFTIGNKGYVGTGDIGLVQNDFYEYNPSSDTWTQKTNFGGAPRHSAIGFSIGAKGYMGTGQDASAGYLNDVWEYDTTADTWTQISNFAGTVRRGASAFTVGNKAYLGTGDNASILNDFWEFNSCNIVLNINTTNSACGMATGTATVVATNGTSPYTYQWTNGDATANADTLSAGLYMVTVTDASGCTEQAPVMINDAAAPVITVNTVTNVTCNGGSNGAITINVTGGSSPYTYFWANGNTNQNMSSLQAGPHEIHVTDASGCVAMELFLVSQPSPISHSISKTNASCGGNNGTATDTASGGTSPYSYA